MSDGMGRELAYLSSHATNRYFIPNWGKDLTRRSGSEHVERICWAYHDIDCESSNLSLPKSKSAKC